MAELITFGVAVGLLFGTRYVWYRLVTKRTNGLLDLPGAPRNDN